MRAFAIALGLTFCTATLAFAQTPPTQQPDAQPGKVVAPTEALPTQGSASAAVPDPSHVEVHFAAGSADIAANERANVVHLAALCSQGQASMIVLVGYPDAPGNPKETIPLSFRRATAVMEALLAQGDLSKLGWEISAVVTHDQHAGQSRNVVGSCK